MAAQNEQLYLVNKGKLYQYQQNDNTFMELITDFYAEGNNQWQTDYFHIESYLNNGSSEWLLFYYLHPDIPYPLQVLSHRNIEENLWSVTFPATDINGIYEQDNRIFLTNSSILYEFDQTNNQLSTKYTSNFGIISDVIFHNDQWYVSNSSAGITVSLDEGVSWQTLASYGRISSLPTKKVITHNDMVFALSSTSNVDNDFVSISFDGGKNWIDQEIPAQVHDMVYHQGKLYVAADWEGLYVFDTEAKTWTEKNPFPGPNQAKVESLAVYNDQVYVGTSGGIYLLESLDSIQQEIEGVIKDIAAVDNGYYYLKSSPTSGYKLYYSGAQEAFSTLAATSEGINNLLANEQMIVVSTKKSDLYISTDQGDSWQVYRLAETFGNLNEIRGLNVHDNLLFVSTAQGLYVTEDYAENWSVINDENFAISRYPWDAFVDDNNQVWIATLSGLFKGSLASIQYVASLVNNIVFSVEGLPSGYDTTGTVVFINQQTQESSAFTLNQLQQGISLPKGEYDITASMIVNDHQYTLSQNETINFDSMPTLHFDDNGFVDQLASFSFIGLPSENIEGNILFVIGDDYGHAQTHSIEALKNGIMLQPANYHLYGENIVINSQYYALATNQSINVAVNTPNTFEINYQQTSDNHISHPLQVTIIGLSNDAEGIVLYF